MGEYEVRPHLRAVIFDWDGTLVDSVDTIVRCLTQAGVHCGLPTLDGVAYRQVIGLGLPEALRSLWPGVGNDQIIAVREVYSELFRAASEQTVWFDGAESLLKALRGEGLKLAVATGKSRRGLGRAFAALSGGEYFVASRCADEARSKPHPQMLHELLDELGVDQSEAIMVGDTTHDVLMASNAGVKGLAVTWGAHSKPQLEAVEPWTISQSFEELCAFFSPLSVDELGER